MPVRRLVPSIRCVLLVLVMVFAFLHAAAPGARAQAIAPYVFTDCLVGDSAFTWPARPPYGVCGTSGILNETVNRNDARVSGMVAVTPDGTRVLAGAQGAILSFARDAAGKLTLTDCVRDGKAGLPAALASCTPLTALTLVGYFDGSGNVTGMALSPDGSSLYVSTTERLVHFTVSTTAPTLQFVQCWQPATAANLPNTSGPCAVIDGAIEFKELVSPVVSADGGHVYAGITAPVDSPFPLHSRRGAVIHFTRDAAGALSYAGCNGYLATKAPSGSSSPLISTPCADTGLDMRNLSALALSPDGTSAYVAGSVADVLTPPYGGGVSRLSRDTTSGTLTFSSCTRIPFSVAGNGCQPGQGGDVGPLFRAMSVSPDSADVYVNASPFTHIRVSGGAMSVLDDITSPEPLYANLLSNARFALDPTGTRLFSPSFGTYGRLNVFARNASTGALSYVGCANSSYRSFPGSCDDTVGGYGGFDIAFASASDALATFGPASVPGTTDYWGFMLASFEKGRVLTISTPTGGTVTSSPGVISCGTRCQDSFVTGTQVSLAATPSTNYVFDGWSGDCSGTTSPCSVTMSTNRNVTANFSKVKVTLTVNIVGGGTITSSPAGMNCSATPCTAQFDINTPVYLTATAATGYLFTGWSDTPDSCSQTTLGCLVSMSTNRTLTATFSPAYTLTVNIAGSGTVVTGSGVAGINCPGDCTETYLSGLSIPLLASPAAGFTFAGWSGDCTGTVCVLTMDGNKTVTATFVNANVPPSAPTGLNAVLTSVRSGRKTVYTGTLTWTDASSNETGFVVQRFKLGRRTGCVLERTFTVAANATSFVDTTASSSTCAYGVAATNSFGTSAFVTDTNLAN